MSTQDQLQGTIPQHRWDVVVVGAGPAGLLTAISALSDETSSRCLSVLVIDHAPSPGRKLLMTGNGQCNLTNALPMNEFISRFGDAGKRIRRLLYGFSNEDLQTFFSELGVETVVREDGKVFPASLRSRDVLDALTSRLQSLGGTIRCGVNLSALDTQEHGFELTIDDQKVHAAQAVIACGGITYPNTGSDGTIWKTLRPLLKAHGLRRTELACALTTLIPKKYPFADLSGLSFPDVTISKVSESGAQTQVGRGAVLFTRKGFSGPAVLDSSKSFDATERFALNFCPSRSRDVIVEELFDRLSTTSKALATEVYYYFDFPRRFIDLIVSGSYANGGIVFNPPYHARGISKKQVRLLVDYITSSVFTVRELGGTDQAMVTRGGFPLDDLDLATLEVESIPGLYFVGECVDVDGDTGGFNLQWAFSSGYAAGQAIASKVQG